ncbi:MAG: hypothetical protein ABIL06_09220 [Pseudomonadota bacterium]
MVGGSEKKALEIVHEAGGETTSHKVSRLLRIDTGYARLLCMNLARKDYVDLKSSGRFRITFKGKRALEKTSSVEAEETGQRVPFKRLSRERLGWGVVSNVGKAVNNTVATFDKPGQDGLVWTTSKIDGSGRRFSGGRRGVLVGKLHTEASHPCGFCKASGEKPKGTVCPVCRRAGELPVDPPAVICAYCKGRGAEKPRSNITCTVCRGRGFVSVKEPIEGCMRCRGTGAEPNNKLPCLKCRGKGVISKKIPPKADISLKANFHRLVRFQMEQKQMSMDRPAKQKRSPTASEIEVLNVYYDAKRQKRPMNASNCTGMSPAYVDMMVRSLVENGFLAAIAPRKYEITPLGIKFLSG